MKIKLVIVKQKMKEGGNDRNLTARKNETKEGGIDRNLTALAVSPRTPSFDFTIEAASHLLATFNWFRKNINCKNLTLKSHRKKAIAMLIYAISNAQL
jgi:hypothetical protein